MAWLNYYSNYKFQCSTFTKSEVRELTGSWTFMNCSVHEPLAQVARCPVNFGSWTRERSWTRSWSWLWCCESTMHHFDLNRTSRIWSVARCSWKVHESSWEDHENCHWAELFMNVHEHIMKQSWKNHERWHWRSFMTIDACELVFMSWFMNSSVHELRGLDPKSPWTAPFTNGVHETVYPVHKSIP